MGEAARASASVSTVSRSSASAEPSREASASTVAGSSGSRVVAVSASSRCQRTSSATRSVPDSSNPIRVAMLRAIGSPATLCSVRLPLPMSWSSAATISTSGRATCRISAAASVQVSTTCRSTVNRWMADACGSSRIRSHSGRICASAPGLLEGLPGAEQPAPRGQQPDQQPACLGRPGIGQRRALAGQPGRRRRCQHDVPLGGLGGSSQQQRGILGRTGPPVEHDLVGRQGDALGQRRQRRAACADARGPGQCVVHPPPGQPGQVGDPAAELAHVHLRRPRVRLPQLRGQCGAELGPQLRRDPVGGPAGEVVHEVAHVEQGHPAALELDVRDVDQPGRDQRLEHGRVADPALGLLEVGHRLVRELAHQVVPRADELVQLRQPLAGVPAPLREHRGAQPKGEVGVTGQVAHVEQAGGDPQVGLRGRDHLGQRPHRVVDVRAGVPQRVPELLGDPAQLLVVDRRRASLTSTTSRSECGASSPRP